MSDRLNTTANKRQNSDSTFKVSPFQSRGFGVQPKSDESVPATKAELWNTYQQAKQFNQNGANKSFVSIQAKLTIGQPGDKYEQEADSVADRVMAMPEPGLATSTVTKSVQTRSLQPIQKVCTDCQEDTQEESKQEGKEDQIQAKESIGQTSEITTTSSKIAEIPNDPTIQRDSPSNLPPIPNYQLTTPSLGQPQDPSSRYKLGGDLSLHLDPQFQSTMQQVQEQVTPTTIRTALSQIKLTLPPSGTPAPATNPLAMPSKPIPAAAPTVPAGNGPDKPRAADGGDIMDAILAVPAIDAAVNSLQTQASDRFTQDWHRLKTGEKIVGISSVVAIGGGLLAGVISDPAARKLALDQLNGKVLPVPKLNWLHLEINTGGDNLMLGLHVDVGQLLPSSWGFKASSPDAIGGVPEPEPLPVQRKLDSTTEGDRSNSDLEARLNSSKGSGSPLTNEIRGFMEPRFGADFSGVRVHTGTNAVQMNRDVNAQAFAHGQDIYFGEGNAPGKNALTAHELTHVVQQNTAVNLSRSIIPKSLTADAAIDLIQRDDANGGKTPQPATANWVAPFDLGVMTNSGDASAALIDIKNKLTEWKDIGYEGEMSLVFNMVERELKASYGVSHSLTTEEANRLTGVGLFANQAYQNALKNLQQAISAELDKFTGIDAQNSVDAVAEQLHQAFMDTESESKIADIRAAFDKSKELSGKVAKYVGYASKAKTIVKSAAKLDDIKKSIEGFKSNMSQASELAGLAQEVANLAGKVSQKPGGTQNDIAQLKSAFKLVDFAISKSSVPIIGQWWDGYIKPCAEIALKKLAELDRMVDESVRLNEIRLDEWWSASVSGAKAPSITDSGLNGLTLKKYFVGGQQMLDFMWSLFRGKGAERVPADIEDTFIKYRAQFNTGQEATNQIETDVHWYDPTSWVGRTKSPNLLSWVNKNKETVWAMLYGRLPHP